MWCNITSTSSFTQGLSKKKFFSINILKWFLSKQDQAGKIPTSSQGPHQPHPLTCSIKFIATYCFVNTHTAQQFYLLFSSKVVANFFKPVGAIFSTTFRDFCTVNSQTPVCGEPAISLHLHMSHWSSELPVCFPSWGTWVQSPGGTYVKPGFSC